MKTIAFDKNTFCLTSIETGQPVSGGSSTQKTLTFDPAHWKVVPVAITEQQLLDLAVVTGWESGEQGQQEREWTLQGWQRLMARLTAVTFDESIHRLECVAPDEKVRAKLREDITEWLPGVEEDNPASVAGLGITLTFDEQLYRLLPADPLATVTPGLDMLLDLSMQDAWDQDSDGSDVALMYQGYTDYLAKLPVVPPELAGAGVPA